MALLSNSLYLDSEYKADCEYKINYLNFLKDKKDSELVNKDVTTPDDDNTIDSKEELKDVFTAIENRVLEDTTKHPIFSDGKILYKTKQISNNFYKPLFEVNNSPLPDIEETN